nr:blue light receptor WC2 [Flammulina filiformis]
MAAVSRFASHHPHCVFRVIMATTNKDVSSVFDFTKRKRWADLLVTELADSIILILSNTSTILYCGSAITELLGWKDSELMDRPFEDLVLADDWESLSSTLRKGAEFTVYSRLNSKDTGPPANALFEIKGRPSMSYFFVMARPYPSRNTAALNTFLDLKIENQRLQQRLRELTGQSPVEPAAATSNRYPPSLPLYTSTSLTIGGAFDEPTQSPATARGTIDALYTTGTLTERNEDEDGGKKKKAKKMHTSDQYVCITCGRTDSPEWRKGPLGPKTLCNACGLRWAKSQRKTDEPVLDGGGGELLTLS